MGLVKPFPVCRVEAQAKVGKRRERQMELLHSTGPDLQLSLNLFSFITWKHFSFPARATFIIIYKTRISNLYIIVLDINISGVTVN